MVNQKNYSGKLCVAANSFKIYKDVDTIDSLIPYQINPEELLFVISCTYHESTYDNIEAIMELKFLYNGAVYQNQFNWGLHWALPIQEIK